MKKPFNPAILGMIVGLAALGGCGGGGSARSATPVAPIPQTPIKNVTSNATATIVIPPKVPASSSRMRNPKWVSPLTMSVDFSSVVNGLQVAYTFAPVTPNSPNCASGPGGLTCTVSFAVVPGTQQITVNEYDAATINLANPLATTTQMVNIVPGVTNPNINFVLNAMPAIIQPQTAPPSFLAGTPSSLSNVAMYYQDADAENITTPWDGPIPATFEDSTHAISVNQPLLNGGTPSLSFFYNGNPNTATTNINWCSRGFLTFSQLCPGATTIFVNLPSQTLYVSNATGGTVEAFAALTTGNVAPIRTVPTKTLNVFNSTVFIGGGGNPAGLAIASNGYTYWTEPSTNALARAGAGVGDTSPVTMAWQMNAAIGPGTTLNQPLGVALDTTSTPWVVSGAGNSIVKLQCCGNRTPLNSITGPATLLNNPAGIALDPSNNIFVTNNGNAILEFAPGANGNVAPINQIAGAATALIGAAGIAVVGTPSNKIYVTNSAANTITIYPLAATGNASPTATISGASTALATPIGVAVDSAGTIYVANNGNNTITEYASGANGNVAPIRTISGASTGLNGPVGVAIRP